MNVVEICFKITIFWRDFYSLTEVNPVSCVITAGVPQGNVLDPLMFILNLM